MEQRLKQLHNWKISEVGHLNKSFTFPDFKSALKFVNQVGVLAEMQDHHPDVFFGWGKVTLDLWTHSEKSITKKDFVLAESIDSLPQ